MANLIADVSARNDGAAQHAVAVRSMFDRISPTYDLLNRLLSVGIDRAWRRRALDALARELPEGPLLDSCAGTLDLTAAVAGRFTDRRVVGADFARDMLTAGRAKVGTETPLAVADAMRLPMGDGVLAGASCAFGMRNLSDTRTGLAEMYRCLKPGGVFVVLEFFRPATLPMRVFHGVYARFVLPTVGFMVSRDREAYGYLARSMKGFYTRQEFEALAREVGFRSVAGEELSLGIASLIRLAK